MKLKRRLLTISLVTILSCTYVLSGCTGTEKSPSEDLVKNSLAESMEMEIGNFLSIKDCSVEESLTEDSAYTATYYVTADSQYAEHGYYVDTYFLKYDQGWQLESAEWSLSDYQIINWPSNDEVDLMIEERMYLVDDYLQNPEYTSVSNADSSMVICDGTISTSYGGYAGIEGEIESIWEYNPNNGEFEFSGDEGDIQLSLIRNIEGVWEREGDSSMFQHYFTIEDQAEDHFSVSFDVFDDLVDTVYLTTTFEEFNQSLKEEPRDYLTIGGLRFESNTDDHKTTITIFDRHGVIEAVYNTNYNDTTWGGIMILGSETDIETDNLAN